MDKPFIEEIKAPVPPPSLVLVDNEMVGKVDVPQTTPLAVTKPPPSELIFPPPVALMAVILVIPIVVVTVGVLADVVKEVSLP